MQPARRSHFLEKELRLILSGYPTLTSAELAKRLHITREEVLPLLQALLTERFLSCTGGESGVIYHIYSNAERAILQTLDEAQEPLLLYDITSELPRHEIVSAVMALVQTGAIEVIAGGEHSYYRAVPCRAPE